MDATTVLTQARAAVTAAAGRNADLVGSLPGLELPVPGSEWSLREVAAHLVTVATVYTECARGTPSLIPVDPDELADACNQLIADVPETDPANLAALVRHGAGELVGATAGRTATDTVCFHGGLMLDVGRLLCANLGEQLLHGFDMARAVGRPYPIDPADARLVWHGYEAGLVNFLNPKTTAGLSAAYDIELRGFEGLTVRFTDGAYGVEPVGHGAVDCRLSADPVAFLLVLAGRLDLWAAIALRHVSAAGERPDLALGFFDLFVYP